MKKQSDNREADSDYEEPESDDEPPEKLPKHTEHPYCVPGQKELHLKLVQEQRRAQNLAAKLKKEGIL